MNAPVDVSTGGPGGAGHLLAGLHAASRAAGAGIYLGGGPAGWTWAGPEHSTLVLGPSRAGKTSSLIVPNVLAAPGAVVSTSTKPDVLARTAPARRTTGWSLLYDPSGKVEAPPGTERVGWSPVATAEEWTMALQVADAMVRTARGRRAGIAGTGDDHWTERAVALLAPLLHAAALDGEPMATVLRWVDRHDGSRALSVLESRTGEGGSPTDVLAGILATDGREQSGIWSTASGVLAAYRHPDALASTEPPYLDADTFCAGSNTLYICATGQQQQLLAPLVVGMLGDVRDAAYRRARSPDGGRPAPVLLALDEVANIAPIPDLPAIVSEGAGQGLLTLACLQDLSQARARWGREADALLSLFGTTVVFPGIVDMPTLEALSAIAGRAEVATRTVGHSQGPAGRILPSVSTSTTLRHRLPVDVIARGRPGAALVVDARNRMGWVGLTPSFAHEPWRSLAHGRATDRDRRQELGRSAAPARSVEGPAPPSGPPGRGRSR
ncbi:MAG: type IV secretory system conjugative DNA transfer family protein [Actinocrinis sp.]